MTRPIATLSVDGQTVTLRAGAWSETFPVDLLPRRIAFYRSLCETPVAKGRPPAPRRTARFYAPTLAALERAAKLAAIMHAGNPA